MIRVNKMNAMVWAFLEKEGFISAVISRNGLSSLPAEKVQVETLYECNDYGGSKLINVGVNLSWPAMFHYHPAHEEVFLLSAVDTKPLYIVFAFDRLAGFLQKQSRNCLQETDFIIVQMIYNHPLWSSFAIKPGVLHGEFTSLGKKANPVLIVTEPSDMTTNLVDISGLEPLFVAAVNKKRKQETV